MNSYMVQGMQIIKERNPNYDLRMQRAIWVDTMIQVSRYCGDNDIESACEYFEEVFGVKAMNDMSKPEGQRSPLINMLTALNLHQYGKEHVFGVRSELEQCLLDHGRELCSDQVRYMCSPYIDRDYLQIIDWVVNNPQQVVDCLKQSLQGEDDE